MTYLAQAAKTTDVSPTHQHDCDRCKYHGSFRHLDERRWRDVYTCSVDSTAYETLILRYSSQPAEYQSHPMPIAAAIAVLDQEVSIALRLAET